MESTIFLIKITFVLLALVALGMFVIAPVIKMLRTMPDTGFTVPDVMNLDDQAELEIPLDSEPKKLSRDQLLEQARADPIATASAVRSWLKEKK